VVIGLTEAILDLGLTEEQLHASIKSYGRQLAAQVHPDRKPTNVSAERQEQIIKAFNYLDNFDNFRLALADFKILRAEDRRESRLLNQTVAVLRERLSEFEGQTVALKEARESLTQEQHQFELQKEQRASDVSSLENKIEILEKKFKTQKDELQRVLADSTPWKRRHEQSLAALVNLASQKNRGVFAFEARWVAVASAWANVDRGAPPVNSHGEIHTDFANALQKLDIESRMQEIIDEWKRISAIYGKRHYYGQTWSDVSFSLIKLEAGRQELLFGNPLAASGTRVIGCIPSDMFWVDTSKQKREEKLETEKAHLRKHLRSNDAYEFVVATMSPYLTPGGLLVSLWTDSHRKVLWSLTCPAFKFITRRIILAVG